MAYALDLGAAPKEGETRTWSDHEYSVWRVTSFTARGQRHAEITWQTRCVECGATVTFKTGMRHKFFPKRCKACNGPGDADKAERRLYVKEAWGERMRAAKAEKDAAAKGLGPVARIEESVLRKIRTGDWMMDFVIVFAGGKREPWGGMPGQWGEGEEMTDAIRALIPGMEAEYVRLMEMRSLMD